jgi:hypothetical protein
MTSARVTIVCSYKIACPPSTARARTLHDDDLPDLTMSTSGTPAAKPIKTGAGHPPLVQQLQERAIEFGQHCAEAVTSLAWLWPVRGILFAVTRERLLISDPPSIHSSRTPDPAIFFAVRGALLRCAALSAAVFAGVAFFTYLPQLAILVFITGPLAPIVAALAVLAESVVLLTLCARQLFLGPALAEVFDGTLRAHGQAELVKAGRRPRGGGKDVGSALVRPLQGVSFDGLVRYLVTLPLNFIPVVGTVFFLLYNGACTFYGK